MENEVSAHQENNVARPQPVERAGLRLPLALTLFALLIWIGFQTLALVLERDQLRTFNTNFEAGMREAEKLRAQLEALVTKTSELASKGSASARGALEELAKKGIPISPTTPPAK
jgi:hypothetical protein